MAHHAITSAVWSALMAASPTRPASRDHCVVVPPAVARDPAGPCWAVLAFDFSAHVPRATPLTPKHAACPHTRRALPASSIASTSDLADSALITSALDGIGPRQSSVPAANSGRSPGTSPSPRLSGGGDHDPCRRVQRQGPVVMVQRNASYQEYGKPLGLQCRRLAARILVPSESTRLSC